MDEGGIDAATLWSEAIVEAINECKVLIMMVSRHSTDSANVVKEVMLASESSKIILPVSTKSLLISLHEQFTLMRAHLLEGGAFKWDPLAGLGTKGICDC